MFYTQLLMSKRGPLAKIWLAAHWDKKLTKAHVFECNIETTIEKMLSPKVTIALRTLGHLLLGVVRIYDRKAKYLLADCNEAFIKMKIAFRPGVVDLPGDNLEATYKAITLPEEFHEFEINLPDINAIDVAEHFTLNQSRAEEITLREDYGGSILHGDSFGDETEIFRNRNVFDDSLSMSANSLFPENSSVSLTGDGEVALRDKEAFTHDGFGDEGIAGDMLDRLLNTEQDEFVEGLDMSKEIPLPPIPPECDINAIANADILEPGSPAESNTVRSETTLLNEEDGFVLEPVDATVTLGKRKTKRKRKLRVDTVRELSNSTMRKQLTDFIDTVTTVNIAPPTRKLMNWKEIGGVENLLCKPSQTMIHTKLQMLYSQCLIPHSPRNFDKREDLEPDQELRKQDIPEIPILEDPSLLQESQDTEKSRTSVPESLILEFQDIQHHGVDEACEMQLTEGVQALDTSLLLNTSLEQEKESLLDEAAISVGFYEDAPENEQDSEERKWNRRTRKILTTLRDISRTGLVSFSLLTLCKDNNRKQASAKFYSFLVLKKQLAIELSQNVPYADVIATPGPRFSTL